MNQAVSVEMTAVLPEEIIKVRGEVVNALPLDLYIPPDALRVFLETFQGPLDLLLYLIKKQNIDILDIPIKAITIQYMHYVDIMRELHLEFCNAISHASGYESPLKSRQCHP